MRLDLALVASGYVKSRTKAQDLIRSGAVSVKNGEIFKQILEPSFIPGESEIQVSHHPVSRYVSRAGLKLESALRDLKMDVSSWRILDIGISTGGFSDCLLQMGAKSILGIDVGHSQLDEKLKQDSRLVSLEGVNVRDLNSNSDFLRRAQKQEFDLAVVDVSFISIRLALPEILRWTHRFLLLIKPQFEVGQANLVSGVVKSDLVLQNLETELRDWISKLGLKWIAYIPSGLRGREGNQEYFLYVEK